MRPWGNAEHKKLNMALRSNGSAGGQLLAEGLLITVYRDGKLLYDGTVAGLAESKQAQEGLEILEPSPTKLTYTIKVTLPTSAGNEYQDKTVTVDLKWWLTSDNIFSTGKIRLNLNDRKPVITENEYLFEPGMTVEKPFFLKNEGADCWYRLYFNNVSGSLSSVLEVTVSDGETVLFTGKMSDLTQSSADWLGILPAVGAAGSCRTLTITFHFPEDAGNAAQGGTLQFDLCADGTQVRNNPNKEFPVESPQGVTYETNLE